MRNDKIPKNTANTVQGNNNQHNEKPARNNFEDSEYDHYNNLCNTKNNTNDADNITK